jgi:hypothetical protein
LYPQALGSLFIASYDSQGYGGSIRTLLHTGYLGIKICLNNILRNKAPTSQKTHYICIRKTDLLMLFREILVVYENHMKHINVPFLQNAIFSLYPYFEKQKWVYEITFLSVCLYV